MQKVLLAGIIGLGIGLTIGFFGANRLNKDAGDAQAAIQPPSQSAATQVQNAAVKDQPSQGSRLPEIAVILDKAQAEPDDFQAQMGAGELYLRIKNYPTAIEFFKKANKIEPDNYETIVKIGNTLFDAQQFEEAGTWYQTALNARPDDFSVRTDFGVTFVERANPDLDRAMREFEISLKANPNHEPTLYNLAVAYYKKGDLNETARIRGQIEKINPQSELAKRLRSLAE